MAASNKIFIVSGTRAEFEYFIRNKAQQLSESGYPISLSDFVYLDNLDKIRGMREVHGYFYGSYRERADLKDILIYIRLANNVPYDTYIIPPPNEMVVP